MSSNQSNGDTDYTFLEYLQESMESWGIRPDPPIDIAEISGSILTALAIKAVYRQNIRMLDNLKSLVSTLVDLRLFSHDSIST